MLLPLLMNNLMSTGRRPTPKPQPISIEDSGGGSGAGRNRNEELRKELLRDDEDILAFIKTIVQCL